MLRSTRPSRTGPALGPVCSGEANVRFQAATGALFSTQCGRSVPLRQPVVTATLSVHHDSMRALFALFISSVALLTAGCASPGLAEFRSGESEWIAFDEQPPPFCGRCDSARLVALSSGLVLIERGHWEGTYRDWRVSRHTVQLSPDQNARFRATLAAYKPLRDTVPAADCADYITDQDGAVVTWLEDGNEVRRVFDFGCLDDRQMNDAVRQSIQRLTSR